jgi:hypothetical protein
MQRQQCLYESGNIRKAVRPKSICITIRIWLVRLSKFPAADSGVIRQEHYSFGINCSW